MIGAAGTAWRSSPSPPRIFIRNVVPSRGWKRAEMRAEPKQCAVRAQITAGRTVTGTRARGRVRPVRGAVPPPAATTPPAAASLACSAALHLRQPWPCRCLRRSGSGFGAGQRGPEGKPKSRSPSQLALIPTRGEPSSLCPLPPSASSACSLPLLALLSRAAWAEAALHFTPPRRTASPAPPRARHRTGRIARISTASPPSQSPPRSCAAALVLRHGCGAARFVADARLDRSSFAVPFGTKTILPRQVRGLWSRSGKVFSVQIRTRSTSR